MDEFEEFRDASTFEIFCIRPIVHPKKYDPRYWEKERDFLRLMARVPNRVVQWRLRTTTIHNGQKIFEYATDWMTLNPHNTGSLEVQFFTYPRENWQLGYPRVWTR